jgi:membrane protease YdiL (CAAX protease family)
VPAIPQPRVSAGWFFAVALGWSCLFWSLTVLLGGIQQFPGSLLQYAGGAGPVVAALILIHFFERPEAQRDFWMRTIDPRRMPWRWLLLALLIHPAIVLVAGSAEWVAGGEVVLGPAAESGVLAFVGLVFFVFVLGPLPEEMGWRGVALDRLQLRMSPLWASLLLGIIWSAWHLPLFLIDGTFQNQLGLGSFRFWVFLADMIPLTIIITWIYNHTDRSTLSAVFVHFSGNLCGALIPKSDRFALFELVVLSIVALAITIRSGPRLGYQLKSARSSTVSR